MAQLVLTPTQRRSLRADAHHLDPVVLIGNDGLTPAVQKEIERALNAHGLIKVRVFSDDRAGREDIYQSLADQLNAAPVQHIGKLLVLWRPPVEKTSARGPDEDGERMAGPREVKVLKYSKRAGHKPEVKVLKVLGNQRLTAGGNVRRAKPKKKTSIKKRQAD
jgi:putative YhbY family RNA-binding protein